MASREFGVRWLATAFERQVGMLASTACIAQKAFHAPRHTRVARKAVASHRTPKTDLLQRVASFAKASAAKENPLSPFPPR